MSEIITKLKENENNIKNTMMTSNKNCRSIKQSRFCVNALTNIKYNFEKSSPEERTLFRVMPLDGKEKIFFDSQDEYKNWKSSQKRHKFGNISNINGIQ